MSHMSVSSRAVAAALVLATVATTGCSWLRRGSDLYAGPVENRPLEVPPPLDGATTAAATAAGATTASAAASGRAAAGAQASMGFSAPGTRDAVYARVGEVLSGMSGLTISSRAQLLGAYDVSYDGANFLVRVTGAESGVTVAVVDPRGLPASGDAPRRVVDALKAALVP